MLHYRHLVEIPPTRTLSVKDYNYFPTHLKIKLFLIKMITNLTPAHTQIYIHKALLLILLYHIICEILKICNKDS